MLKAFIGFNSLSGNSLESGMKKNNPFDYSCKNVKSLVVERNKIEIEDKSIFTVSLDYWNFLDSEEMNKSIEISIGSFSWYTFFD